MNKISLAFALVFFIALSFTGCKSTKKVGTVEAGGAKAHNEFFTLMQEQAFKYETLTARLNVDLNLPGNNMSSRVDLKMVKDSAYRGFPRRDQCGQRKGNRPYEQALCG